MRILGIIAEYNPFHKGHAWQIKTSKQESGCDAVFALMSGSITQRGEFALLNKWERTRLALSAGVDLVCELPFCYAGQSAEAFASGGIKIFNATAIVDVLSFGSEFGFKNPLNQLSKILADEPLEFKHFLKESLSHGVSFPKAREIAISKFLGIDTAALLKTPNNILAVEYLKALHKTKSVIASMTIKRQGADYHSIETSEFLSATGIRAILKDLLSNPKSETEVLKKLEDKLPYPIEAILSPLKNNFNSQGDERYLNALRLLVLSRDVNHLLKTPYVNEGLEHKIRDSLKTALTLDDCVSRIISKRIPETRVRRILSNRLLELDKEALLYFQTEAYLPYLRVLGFTRKGKAILKSIKTYGTIPILTNLKKSKYLLSPMQKKMLYYDCRATELHNLFYENSYHYHQDYTLSPVFVQND
jgi:predicted nucleotidyltransferase